MSARRLSPEALLAARDSRLASMCLNYPSRFSFLQFKEELLWRNKEWVFLKHPSDNHHGVNPQHVHHHVVVLYPKDSTSSRMPSRASSSSSTAKSGHSAVQRSRRYSITSSASNCIETGTLTS